MRMGFSPVAGLQQGWLTGVGGVKMGNGNSSAALHPTWKAAYMYNKYLHNPVSSCIFGTREYVRCIVWWKVPRMEGEARQGKEGG